MSPRRRPSQARSRQTVEDLLEGTARVFLREGWGATTNRIAEAAGVSVGTLYEYFPNKDALLLALAVRHVDVAETELDRALAEAPTLEVLIERLQRGVLLCQRFPSEALELVRDVPRVGPQLLLRSRALRARAVDGLATRIAEADLDVADASALAEVVFGVIGELTVRALRARPDDHAALTDELRAMALHHLRARAVVAP